MKFRISVSDKKRERFEGYLTEHGVELSEEAEYKITEPSRHMWFGQIRPNGPISFCSLDGSLERGRKPLKAMKNHQRFSGMKKPRKWRISRVFRISLGLD